MHIDALKMCTNVISSYIVTGLYVIKRYCHHPVCYIGQWQFYHIMKTYLQSTLVISNFTGPDKNVRVISSSRQPNCDVIGMTTVHLNVLERHMYMAI